MGYYTKYELIVSDGDYLLHGKNLEEVSGCCSSSIILGNREIKWYDHEDNMKEYSKQHPTVLFTLIGLGEDSELPWTKYFYNGKMQVAHTELVVEEFRKEKLV